MLLCRADTSLRPGHHRITCLARNHGFPPRTQDRIFRPLPRHIPAKLLRLMAAHLPHLPLIRRVLRPRRRGPLHLVLSLLAPHAQRAPRRAPGVSRRARGEAASVWRDGDVLRDLRLAHPALPLPEPERE